MIPKTTNHLKTLKEGMSLKSSAPREARASVPFPKKSPAWKPKPKSRKAASEKAYTSPFFSGLIKWVSSSHWMLFTSAVFFVYSLAQLRYGRKL